MQTTSPSMQEVYEAIFFVLGYHWAIKWILLDWIVGILLIEWALTKYNPLRVVTAKDQEQADKYPEFRRNDCHKVTRPYLYILAPFMLIRFFTGWGMAGWCSVTTQIAMIGHPWGEVIPMWRRRIIIWISWCTARVILASMGTLFVNTEDVEADYSKYLGPDWKPTLENASTIISNHQSIQDILVHMLKQEPSHVAKSSIKKVPFAGPVTMAVGSLFVDRGDKGQHNNLLDLIKERQKECEKGLYPSLIIYPEGGTTNGTHLISFKKGAFAGLRSISPVVIDYQSPFNDVECCVINFVAQSVICGVCPFTNVYVKYLPIFEPNDFFFQHHQRKDEEKW